MKAKPVRPPSSSAACRPPGMDSVRSLDKALSSPPITHATTREGNRMTNAEHRQLPVTFGTPLQQVAVGGFHLTEARYAADVEVPAHEHTHPSWTLVLAGDFEEAFRDETIRCTAG